jgi:hypothetical protein
MDEEASYESPATPPETPGAWLDALRDHPEWPERARDQWLGRLVERFGADDVVVAVQVRLIDLSGADAEAMLRLVEAYPRPALLRALATAIEAQPGLAPERAWEALGVLEGAGMLDLYPALAERWDELNETLDGEGEGSIEQLIAQIEGDTEGLWLALQGFGAVEPEVRAQIVEGLGGGTMGPGLVEFLRLLAYAHDPGARAAALKRLLADDGLNKQGCAQALFDLAEHHPDPAVADAAQRRIAQGARELRAAVPTVVTGQRGPRITRSLVTAIDGGGRGSVALGAVRGEERVTAAFLCDIDTGVREVFGAVATGSADADATFDAFAEGLDRDLVEGAPALALGLLAGCLTLCGPATSPALRYWIEATAGPELRPHPFRAEFPAWDPLALPFAEMTGRAEAVLDACPDWIDGSLLTYELAEEILLREGDSPPDPRRDAGAYRFLFEHRLKRQLEGYRRMLLWMAWFWRSSGEEERAHSAMALAWQLSDAQHVVPGHPFTVALTTRSLIAAQNDLKQGFDPRKTSRR